MAAIDAPSGVLPDAHRTVPTVLAGPPGVRATGGLGVCATGGADVRPSGGPGMCLSGGLGTRLSGTPDVKVMPGTYNPTGGRRVQLTWQRYSNSVRPAARRPCGRPAPVCAPACPARPAACR